MDLKPFAIRFMYFVPGDWSELQVIRVMTRN
jgi:hypothetical protein